jgi:DNA-binding NtrC family response regulator
MDLSTQISLLRVLETYRFTRVGANKERDADVRIIAATNRDLLDLVESNQFREDLYYRLNVFTIAIPPLRERAEDVVPIAERFLRFFAKRYGTPARCLSDKALERLLGHQWPGNVRELRNVMEQTAVFAQREVVHADEIQFISTRLPTHQKGRGERSASSPQFAMPSAPHHDMPAPAPEPASEAIVSSPTPPPIEVTPTPVSPVSSGPISSTPAYTPAPPSVEAVSSRSSSPGDEHPLVLRIPVGTPLAEAERMLIIKTLEVSDGNKQRAARILGISRRGLYTKLAAYGEHVPADEAADNGVAGENGVNAGETVNSNEHGDPPTPDA